MSDRWSGSLESLRRSVLDAPADTAASTIAAWVADRVGGVAEVRLADRAGVALHPAGVSAGRLESTDVWSLDDGQASEALWTRQVRWERGTCVHIPLVARGTAQGVLTVHDVSQPAAHVEAWAGLGEAAAVLLGQAGQATDAWEVRRRSASFSVSAELQWQLLPPTSVIGHGVELHALVEPTPRVSSDLFDWSLDHGTLWLAVLDAEGRNLSAALPAAVALTALRHARRCRSPLAEQVSLADQAVHDEFRGHAVVRALVIAIDLDDGSAQAVAAGDADAVPRVLRRRGGTVTELSTTRQEDLGRFERSRYRAEALDTALGDDLLAVSDGGPEAQDGDGPFGMPAIAEHFAAMQIAASHPRRLLDLLRRHSGGGLLQDATALVAHLHP